VVLVIAGHDPCGGAGIQADIEAITSSGCHAVTTISSLTVQNTCEFRALYPVAPKTMRQQLAAILDDTELAACKIGLLPNAAIANAVAEVLSGLIPLPTVLDPVLASGSGTKIAEDDLIEVMIKKLFPVTTVLTPNLDEARRLTRSSEGITAIAERLSSFGCESVLITGADEQSPAVMNHLYRGAELLSSTAWERLPGVFHGSGCTLSASLAAELAKGAELVAATKSAQEYTWETLNNAYQVGQCQSQPDRLFATRLPGKSNANA